MTRQRNVPEDVTGAILIGGKSRRLGCDKILLPYRGKPLVLHLYGILSSLFNRTSLIGYTRPELDREGLECIPDQFPDCGVLGGICTALINSSTDHVFVAAGDMPFLTQSVVNEILSHRHEAYAVIPAGPSGMEPLCAVYSKSCLEPMLSRIERKRLKVIDALAELSVFQLRMSPDNSGSSPFFNINTPEDLEKLISQDQV